MFSSINGLVEEEEELGNQELIDDGFVTTYSVTVGLRGARDEHVHEWWALGQVTHRPNGPAMILSDRETGFVLREEYRWFGKRHRIGGATIREIDPETEVVTREEFYEDDQLHNNNGPAIIERDRLSGEIINAKHYWNGIGEGDNALDPDKRSL